MSYETRTSSTVRAALIGGAIVLCAALVWFLVSCNTDGPDAGGSALDNPVNPAVSATDAALGEAPDDGTSAGPGGATAPGGGTDGGGATAPGGDQGGGNGGGGNGGGGAIVPSPQDCIAYDPATLNVSTASASGWYLRNGTHAMSVYDTKTDADDALLFATLHNRHCYIGRGNTRPNSYAYIVEYWLGSSNLPKGKAPSKFDCVPLSAAALSVQLEGDHWALVDATGGSHTLLVFDSAADAERGRIVAVDSKQLCFIGRGNSRPNPQQYVHEFWRS